MSYIETTDITDTIVVGFDIDDYITESDAAVNDLAERKGVRDSDDIETDSLHFKIKRYAIVYVIMRVCRDKMGTNNTDLPVEIEKYAVKYEIYRKELASIDKQITYEMITGEVNEIRDRTTSSRAIRG